MKQPLSLLAASVLFGHSLVSVAATECASAADRAALRTAAIQQELMVAALKCGGVNEYNRFVLSHQPELISSDHALEAYFQRGDKVRGTATYNKYKTELANAASLRSSRDPDGFCDSAGRAFSIALQPLSLSEIVASVDLTSDPAFENCPVLADNASYAATSPLRPVRTAREAAGAHDPHPAYSALSSEADDDGDDAGQSLDSQVQTGRDTPPPYGAFDDEPDE